MKISSLSSSFVFLLGSFFFIAASSPADTLQPQKTKVPQNSPRITHRRITLDQLVKQLQLTSDQQKLLRKSRAAHRKQIAIFEGLIKVKQVELESELERPEPDKEHLSLLTQQIGTLYGQRLNEKVNANLELEKTILTPQQVEQLKALISQENSETDQGLVLQN